jgi:hypothetical protein
MRVPLSYIVPTDDLLTVPLSLPLPLLDGSSKLYSNSEGESSDRQQPQQENWTGTIANPYPVECRGRKLGHAVMHIRNRGSYAEYRGDFDALGSCSMLG